MCGLIAMFTTEKTGFVAYDKEELKQMMVINSIRGAHSTGLAGVNMQNSHKPHVIKSVGSPYSLFAYGATNQFFDKVVSLYTAVIGHGRYATKGDVNAPNAHPFTEGHITLAHNGVINNYYSLRDHAKHKDIEVDSHLIARLISEEGAINVLPRVTGAYVFIWYDSVEETFNIARNKERPLWCAKQADKNTLTFSSEYQTLYWNEGRNDTKYDDVFEIEPMAIYTYHKDSITPSITEYKQEVVKIPTYVAPKYERTTALTAGGFTLKEGEQAQFTLHDIENSSKDYALVTGYSDLFPDVKFRASFRGDVTDEQIYNADTVRGIISSIFPLRNSTNDVGWQVFLTQATLHTDDEDERVDITNFTTGEVENISKYRLKQIASEGCTWCTEKIPLSDFENVVKPQLFTYGEKGNSLVCPSCVLQSEKGNK